MGNQNRLIFIPMRLKYTLNERKYYVTYNRGRGQGKGLEKEFDQKTFSSTDKPKVFSSYSDAKKYAEKMEKMFRNSIGGGTAYWVSDEKMNPIKESVNEGAGTLTIEKRKDGKYYWQYKFKSGKKEDWPEGFNTKADAQKDFMYRSKYIKEVVNEGRELKSIQSDLNKTIVAIQSEISSYKATKGTPQEKKHIDNLKKLHPIKKKLESELESAVSGLYKDAELKIED
jgi:hypothetical protein